MSIFSIIDGLKTYKDRSDEEKGSMRSWVINMWNLLDNKDMPEALKLWCKLSVTNSVQIYEFLIDNYRESFKGVKAENGLKEIVVYLAFNSLAIGGDPFINKVVGEEEKSVIVCGENEYKADSFGKVKFDSIDEFIIQVGYIFGFDIYSPTYQSFDLYMRSYLTNNKKRRLEAESDFLLLTIINETSSPISPMEEKELPVKMKWDFKQNLTISLLSFNEILKEKRLL